MRDIVDDLREECLALHEFVSGLTAEEWKRPTVFWSWSTWDEIMHLHFVDEFGVLAMTDREGFEQRVKEMRAGQAEGQEISAQARARYAGYDRDRALEAWHSTSLDLIRLLKQANPKQRIPWFGPDMGPASFASARQMETWAHGQDIFDLFGVRRPNADRILNICELGVRTFKWSFVNRGLTPPSAPEVRLISPSGKEATWNEGAPEGSVSGTAEDFCLVVTQRRHVEDTGLLVTGENAGDWMRIAQCFAGAPADGPAPGERAV